MGSWGVVVYGASLALGSFLGVWEFGFDLYSYLLVWVAKSVEDMAFGSLVGVGESMEFGVSVVYGVKFCLYNYLPH